MKIYKYLDELVIQDDKKTRMNMVENIKQQIKLYLDDLQTLAELQTRFDKKVCILECEEMFDRRMNFDTEPTIKG